MLFIRLIIMCSALLLSVKNSFAATSANFEIARDAVVASGGSLGSVNFYFPATSLGESFGGQTSSASFSINQGSVGIYTQESGGTRTIEVCGQVSDDHLDTVTVRVNNTTDYPTQITGTSYVATGVVINEGANTITSIARDRAGNSSQTSITVYLDTLNPFVPIVNTPATPTSTSTQTLYGIKEKGTSIWINGTEIIPANDNTEWSYEVTLVQGQNQFSIFSKDRAANQSAITTITIILDTTKPSTPLVIDDGIRTASTTTLHATWSAIDTESGIKDYRYSIGTAPGATDVVAWKSSNTATATIESNLSLIEGQTYYFNVQAQNNLNVWSDAGSSDGIIVGPNQNPQIHSLQPANNSRFTTGDVVPISVVADDPDGNSLEYRFLSNGNVLRDWSSANTYDWQTQPTDLHMQTITAEVRDSFGGSASQQTNVYILRKVPQPK